MNSPLISLTHVSRTFTGVPDVHALTDVNFSVQRGDYISIVGPSGSGKSTLLNVLGLLDLPTSGSYQLAGAATTSLDPEQRTRLRARTIGFVFQSFHLVPTRTVFDNVLLGMLYNEVPRRERGDRAEATLTRLGLEHRLHFKPPVLSGGERQRLAIARAIAPSPAVLLADEPTGNLDGRTSREVLDIFDELHASGLTILVITHDETVAHRAVRSVRVRDGHLEEIR